VDELLHWSDSLALNTTIPSYPTSLRSDRTIDYTFNRGISLTLQTCDDNTTSDHKPLIGVISCEIKENTLGSNIHWKVFH
jgi:endonuclease/exonuclease/phosphatase (EEP) superfamily protein YafD